MPSDEPDSMRYDRPPGEVEAPNPPQQAEFPVDDAEYGYWDPETRAVQPLPPHLVEPGSKDDGGTSEQTAPQPVEFDERWLKEFEGLLYIGALTSQFSWLGHKFLLRTLKTDEVLRVGQIIAPYVGTAGENKAYQAAVLAGATLRVDGKELPIPLTGDPDALMQDRFNYLVRWFPPTLDHVYDRYLVLEMKAREVIDAMGKALG